jgi:hypothetical protein
MSMSICEVKAAFRQVASEEFKDVPQEDRIEWHLSKQFEKRMSKLIRNEKSFTWKYVNTAKKTFSCGCSYNYCAFCYCLQCQTYQNNSSKFLQESI